ncbi:PREDICTED: cyclin-T2 isoform X2 [Dinoponera quadriceps]|uniref:Cyclin-T2 isoform X2 n=1 Tax=Dinoponera quadriceps TaxID=609295 RepID=A0A6P3WYQ9_DINQU|nr:PREDICTED: cyclin-T2 isoform X2 [Dinoponera quadriceps]
MATNEKWYFSKEQLANTPSRRCGIEADKELSYRQQAANFIQDMGQRLMVSQLCINTAIVYMHRFYVYHSFTQFHRNAIAVTALFLAAKVEEQPRKLEHVIKMAHMCLHRNSSPPEVKSDQYTEQAQNLVFNENVLLQTLGFDVAIDHPHTHIVRCCQLVKASKDLAQTSYLMASNSLHLTTMCLQYKPTVVACFCIHLTCKWSEWEIPQSNEGKPWFWYVDKAVTAELLHQLTLEFLHIFGKVSSKLSQAAKGRSPSMHHPSLSGSPFDIEPHKIQSPATSDGGPSTSHASRPHHSQEKQEKPGDEKGATSSSARPIDYREYREKKERERLEREKSALASMSTQGHITDPNKHHSHHHKLVTNMPNKHQLPSMQKSGLHHNHHHRPDVKVNPVLQRHSAGTQIRETSRDPNRQRLPREYIGGTSTGSVAHPSRDVSLDAAVDVATHQADVGAAQNVSHGNSQEKPSSNNNYNLHRLNTLDGKQQPYDKRMHELRRSKPTEHKKDGEPKAYGDKYTDLASRVDRQRRKSDTLEQRCEEVRKLIEKPLPLPPKPTEAPYMLNAQKQAHHSKYEKSLGTSHAVEAKHSAMGQSALTQDKSPSAPTAASTVMPQVSQKSTPARSMHNQHSAYGVSQILKDTIKNGSSQPCLSTLNNVDDTKLEKRPRIHDDSEKISVDVQQQTPPTSRHRSLFSPETPTTREPHVQKLKSKQKTPAVRAIKQERVSPFTSPMESQQQDSLVMKRSSSDNTVPHKRPRTTSTGENTGEHPVKVKTEDSSSLEAMRILGRVPELIQPIRDAPLSTSSGQASSSAITGADVKPPTEQFVKYELDATVPRLNATITQHKVASMSMQALTNGLDSNPVIKQECLEQHVKKEQPHRIQQPVNVKLEQSHSHSQQPRLEYSPMKSAQSISALLQEPLAPMPSLLQVTMQHISTHSQQMQPDLLQQQQQQQSTIHLLTNQQFPMTTSSNLSVSTASDTASIISTVDMSALSCVPLAHQSSGTELMSVPLPIVAPIAPVSEEKRSDHHKIEKKKKKKKHKEKDKSREKHKHKHKDKDKEKHREKGKERSEEIPAAAPIKITIPKDKLNLSTEASPNVTVASAGNSAALSNKSPQNTGLKIKIPKERLKGTDSVPSSPAQPVVQGPLKIKIRTDSISRSSAAPPTTSLSPQAPPLLQPTAGSSSSSGATSGSHAASEPTSESASRKRERTDQESGTTGQPSTKKQSQLAATSYGHRPGERQNGRHYSSGSSNKERHTSSHHKNSSKLSQSHQ